MDTSHAVYRSDDAPCYLIRLWRAGPREPWRATAKHVPSGREVHFASLEKLFLFLHEQTVDPVQSGM